MFKVTGRVMYIIKFVRFKLEKAAFLGKLSNFVRSLIDTKHKGRKAYTFLRRISY